MPTTGLKRAHNVHEVSSQNNPDLKKQKLEADAYRRAMLKVRFADTIMKAQEKGNRNLSNEAMEKKKSDTAAKIRAAKMELTTQRQNKRKAARLALDRIQRTTEWNDSAQVQQEFEKLIGIRNLSY